jgi:hypothetical protein
MHDIVTVFVGHQPEDVGTRATSSLGGGEARCPEHQFTAR